MLSPEFMTGLNQFTTLITGLGVLVAALVSLVKPFRLWFIKRVSSKTDIQEALASLDRLNKKIDSESGRQELIKDATLSLTRNSLTRIYYRALDYHGISEYDRDNFIKMYASYAALGGNSYIHEIYEKILKMRTIPDYGTRSYRTAKKKTYASAKKTTTYRKAR